MSRPQGDGASPRRYFVETWGCQMNELDSQRMAGQLMEQGLLPTSDASEADLILLNSCSVRDKAEQKVLSRLGEYRRYKEDRPGLRIGLCGCVAQQLGESALKRVPELDLVLGPARVGELTALWPRLQEGERVVATGFPREREHDFESIVRDGTHKGMVTAIEGCDKRCTFCIVPSTRGPERCRPLAEIVAEVRHLLAEGFLEIELLGQTINHWREPGGDLDFSNLLDAVAVLPGLHRLRFVTSYPRDFTDRMVERFRRHPNLADYLHLPVQSGSDRVLRRMGRGYEIAAYRELVDKLREARPGLALTTDLIVGFPGETEEDFEATLDLVRELRFAGLFAFCYSPRPGTAALRLGPEVDREVAERRLQRLLALQQEIQREIHREMLGRELEVLVTGPGRKESQLSGRTSCHRIVHFQPRPGEPAPRPGALATVRLERAFPNSFVGTLTGTVHASRPVPRGGARDRRSGQQKALLPVVSG